MELKHSLTYIDIIKAGACTSGVLEACDEHDVFFCTTEEALATFGNRQIIEYAANMDGYGDGYGDGDGDGYGYGSGYGSGYGYGSGSGYGYGYGDGYGDGDGYGSGSGYGYGYGSGSGDGGI